MRLLIYLESVTAAVHIYPYVVGLYVCGETPPGTASQRGNFSLVRCKRQDLQYAAVRACLYH